jgi:hypothetical protein
MILTGNAIQVEREVLIGFDLLLVLVLGLLLYSISARDPQQPPGRFDIIQLLLVASALIVDVLALWAIAARVSEFGFSANKTAALVLNLLLLVNLVWSAVLYIRFPTGRSALRPLGRWQDSLPDGLCCLGLVHDGVLSGNFQLPVGGRVCLDLSCLEAIAKHGSCPYSSDNLRKI